MGNDNNDHHNDDDKSGHKFLARSVIFKARTSRFCIEVDIDNSYNMMMMKMAMILMMMMIIAVTRDDDDVDNDEDDGYSCNSVNAQAKTSKFCMEVDLDNTCNINMM